MVVGLKDMQLIPDITADELRLAKAMTDLMAVTPQNEFGFPLGLYRPDLLPMHNYREDDVAMQDLIKHQLADQQLPEQKMLPAKLYGEQEGIVEYFYGEGEEYEEDLDVNPDGAQDEPSADGKDPETYLTREAFPIPSFSSPTSQVTHADRVAGFVRSELRAAYIPLAYEQGFPTLPDGSPIWEQFDFEPRDAYICFTAFKEMPLVAGGVRNLSDLAEIMELNELLSTGGRKYKEFTAKFRIFYQLYCWGQRIKAYELYKAAARRKMAEQRALETTDYHYDLSKKLTSRLVEYLNDEELFWEQMTPKVAADLLKILPALQRISAGLPGGAPPNEQQQGQQGQSFEMILRTIAQQGVGTQEAIQSEDSRIAARILDNPETTRIAQELILRMNTGMGSRQ